MTHGNKLVVSEQLDLEIWQMLTGGNNNPAVDSNDASGSVDEGDGDVEHSMGILPTVMHITHKPEVAANDVVEIAPAQGQIIISFFVSPMGRPYPRHFPVGKNHFNEDKYANAHMKCSDSHFAADSQYTFCVWSGWKKH